MVIKRSVGEKLFNAFNIIFLCMVAVVMIFPFWHVLVQSVLPYEEAVKSSIHIIPKKLSFEAYKYVFTNGQLLNGLYISIIVTVLGTVYQLLITTMTAYSLTKKDLPGRNIILTMIIITMFFGGGLIPYYLLIKSIHLVDNILVMILPAAISTYNMIVVKTFFNTLPIEMEESAKIDGAGYIRIFFYIILPLSVPVLSTIGLFIAVGQWNSWYTPMLFINDKKLWPIALHLRDILIDNNTEFTRQSGYKPKEFLLANSIKMAVVIISVIPVVIIYPFVQKHFVKGVMIGAIKS